MDSDCKKWGQLYCGKEIKDPKEILQVDRETYMVLVLSSASADICRILETMGLEQGADYVTLSQLLDGRHELVRYINAANMLLDFLDTVPKELKDRKPDKGKGKIGIVMSIEGQNAEPDFPYTVALFLILKWRGYHAQLMIDNLHWAGDLAFYRGFCDDCDKILSELVCKLKTIVPPEDLVYFDTYGKIEISEQDIKECERVAEYSAKGQKWRKIANFAWMTLQSVEEHFVQIFKHNIGYVKAFFDNNDCESVNVSTALHRRAGIIHYVCSQKGIRVSSQDSTKGKMILSADGIASYGGDITRVVKEQWIPAEWEEEVLQCAEDMARERFAQTKLDETFRLEQFEEAVVEKGFAYVSLQGAASAIQENYDAIIPLNAPNDGAALGIHTIFSDRKQWLIEILDFLINQLGKRVLLREHPVLKILPASIYTESDIASTEPEILEPYKNSKLLYYANFHEDINLYKYMEQCRVVLPWTSTVGMEAAIMQKNLVVHTDVFYGNSAFAMKAHSKEEYFEFIRMCVETDDWLVKDRKLAQKEALKYFYFGMKRNLYTDFTLYESDYHCTTHKWLHMNFEELLKEKGVEEIVQIVAENIPSVYLTARQ